MTARIVIDQIVDAAAARVTVTRDAAGVLAAAFDLGGLPRVDAYLVGRPVTEVPGLVEHLCGICPAAHHLAGIRALESLAKVAAVPPTAEAIRRLLHYAGVIAVHVVGFVAEHRDAALTLRRFAKAAMAAAGSPGHFPATAVPGGVAAPVTPAARDQCAALLAAARAAAVGIARQALAQSPPPDGFAGADVALVSPAGFLDLFGFSVRAVAADGTVVTTARPGEWDDVVAESEPGSAAPRPYLRALGAGTGAYRVGPVAQLRAGLVATPLAAELQTAWRRLGSGAAAARAIITVHAVEVIEALLDDPALTAGPVATAWPGVPAGVGVGLVDGARGLLVHRYATTADGRVAAATILTPTAQNEPWLGDMLTTAASRGEEATVRAGMEDAIREADPCLPCSAQPTGTMDLVVTEQGG